MAGWYSAGTIWVDARGRTVDLLKPPPDRDVFLRIRREDDWVVGDVPIGPCDILRAYGYGQYGRLLAATWRK